MRELIIDLFAGGGGASEGIKQALGIDPDIAINHDPEAIRMHWLNHPKTRHIPEDIWKLDPLGVVGDRPVGLLWASPDCTHHSKAKGGKPRSNKRRCLADVVVDWAKLVRPRLIMLENVPEFEDWGPLDKKGQPLKDLKGFDFKRWVNELRALGYKVEWKLLKACDYGVPTSRERLFLIARCDGEKIVWPEVTHGEGLKPYRTAAECIDWSIPCPSIFLTKKELRKMHLNIRRPLAENTMDRIARGLKKFVFDNPEPFIIAIDNKSSKSGNAWGLSEPLKTIVTENRFALITPFLMKYFKGVTGIELKKPMPTVTTIDHNAIVLPFLTKYHGSRDGKEQDARGQILNEPLLTQDTQNRFGLVSAFLLKYYGCGDGQNINEPMHTVTTKERFGLVTVANQDYQIIDIGLRMLTPRELLKAHDFPEDYVLVGTRTTQVAKIGNSVPPTMAKVLAAANVKIREITNIKVG